MIASVRAVTPSQYERYIQTRKTELKAANDAAAVSRKKLQAQSGTP
jgi:hypothetical protein